MIKKWITAHPEGSKKGVHIPIEEGQTKAEAIKAFSKRQEYRQNTSYNEILKANEDKPAIINESGKTLTRQELAIWSSKLAGERYGVYIKTLPDGTKVIRAEKKAVFTKGTFEKPIITKIYEFESDIEISAFMEFL